MRKIYCLFLMMAVTVSVAAAPVSPESARLRASAFFGTAIEAPGSGVATLAHKSARRSAPAQPAYYVFNNSGVDGGWVIIAGDDRVQPILAYGLQGSFDIADVEDCVMSVLDMYASGIDGLDNVVAEEPSVDVMAAGSTKTTIAPLLQCNWGQSAPFYLKCPQVSSKYCVTGCVATAFSQVMYYHKWPARSTVIPAYTPTGLSEQSALSAVNFDWSHMINNYARTETDITVTANNAVATLLRYVGQAYNMNYGTGSSGAQASQKPLVEYFSYAPSARTIARADYTSANWQTVIYNELANSRPVVLSGSKPTGGHAFVCDGYDSSTGLFHINWGWYGNYNGYFSLDLLNSNGGGIGSAEGADGYIVDLRAMINLQPKQSNVSYTSGDNLQCFYKSGLPTAGSTTITRSSTSTNFTLPVTGGFWNNSNLAGTYDLAWGAYNGTSLTNVTTIVTARTLEATYYTYPTSDVSFGTGVSSGTFYLKQMCRRNGDRSWNNLIGSGDNYIKVVVNNNTATVTPVSSISTGMTCSNVSYTGTLKKGHTVNVVAQLKNPTTSDFHIVYLFVNGACVTANSAVIGSGATSQATFHFVPTKTGNLPVKLATDPNGNNVIYNGYITISDSPSASLVLNPTLTGVTNGIAKNNYVGVTIKVTNQNSTSYSDLLIVDLIKETPTGGNFIEVSKSLNCSVGASSTANLSCQFDKLENGVRYFVRPRYYSEGTLTSSYTTSWFTVQTGNAYDVNNDGAVNAGDVSAIYNVMLGVEKDSGIISRANVNGDSAVNAGDVSSVYSKMLGN